MNQWMQHIQDAAMKETSNLDCDARELFSETECSDDDEVVNLQNTSSPLSSQHDKSSEQTPPSKHYHLNFGSLKKTFARGSSSSNDANSSSTHDSKFLGFFSSNKGEKKNNDIIVPTAQFKTYRKVKENNGGLQLGATSMINSNVSDVYLSSSANENSSFFSNITSDSNFQKEEISIELGQKLGEQNNKDSKFVKTTAGSLRKPHNFLHASNPNLLDLHDFYHNSNDFPSANHSASTWDHQITGQITLLDLMQQQLAEEKIDMYNKRVDQGFEKYDDKNVAAKTNLQDKKFFISKNVDPFIEKIQKRSLPITPDYAQSFKPDDQAIMYARSKEGLKLRDFGYELISNDDDIHSRKFSHSHSTSANEIRKDEGNKIWSKRKIVPLSGSTKKKGTFNWIISNDKDDTTSCLGTSSGSFRKMKKMDEPRKISNAQQDQPSTSKISYFQKLPFANSNIKERKLLGSPKLHRAIFGSPDRENEIFTSITFPKVNLIFFYLFFFDSRKTF